MTLLAKMVEALLLAGCSRHLVEAEIAQDPAVDPKPTTQEIDAAYAECVDIYVRNAEEDPKKILAFHFRKLDFIYQKSVQEKDLRTALASLKEQARMESLYGHQIRKAREDRKEDTEVRSLLEVIYGGKKQRKQPTDNRRTGKAARG